MIYNKTPNTRILKQEKMKWKKITEENFQSRYKVLAIRKGPTKCYPSMGMAIGFLQKTLIPSQEENQDFIGSPSSKQVDEFNYDVCNLDGDVICCDVKMFVTYREVLETVFDEPLDLDHTSDLPKEVFDIDSYQSDHFGL
jgi:hypothetical protein